MITTAVVGHVDRQHPAHRLKLALGGHLFLDNGELGENLNHRRAWDWLATSDPAGWALTVQDDAVPIPGMLEHLERGLATLPGPGLVSLYLGTGYPVYWQTRIRRALQRAERAGASWIRARSLLHGVAVAAPAVWAGQIAEELAADPRPYDEVLSRLAGRQGWPVYYTRPSLVDHADGPSLIRNRRERRQPRRAWQVGEPVWDSALIELR